MSELLWRGWREVEAEEREARYQAAYREQPETAEEGDWADAAADDLLTEDSGWAAADVDATS